MSNIGSWKLAAAANNATPPNGWPEGQAPSTVNNCAREMMSAIRTQWDDAAWFNFYPTVNPPVSLKVQNKIRISDQSAGSTYMATDIYPVGTRLKVRSSGVTVYGSVISLSSSSTAVMLTFTPDTGTLTATVTSVARSIITPTNSPIPGGGGVGMVSGVANQIDVDNSDPANPDVGLSSTIITPGSLAVTALTASTALVSNAAKEITSVPLTDGQLLIGSTGVAPVAASLIAGSNVTITPGAGTITIASTGGGGGVSPYFYIVFNTLTTTSIIGSLNVTSLTDNGVGDTTVTYTTPFANTNYTVASASTFSGGGFCFVEVWGNSAGSISPATGSIGVVTVNTVLVALVDCGRVCVVGYP